MVCCRDRIHALAALALLALVIPAIATAQEKLQINVTSSSWEQQSGQLPGRYVYLPGTGAVARGPETVYRNVAHVNATVLGAGNGSVKISLTCVIQKKGDDKHCATLNPGIYQAERKGNDKLIVYAWKNPLDQGNLAKANKAEYIVGTPSN